MVELNRYCWCLNMLKHHHFDDLNQCVGWLNCRDEWFPVRLRQDAAEGKPAATVGCARQAVFPRCVTLLFGFCILAPEMLFFFWRISNLTGRKYPPLIKHGNGNSSIYSRWFFPLNRHFGFSTAMFDYQRVVVMFPQSTGALQGRWWLGFETRRTCSNLANCSEFLRFFDLFILAQGTTVALLWVFTGNEKYLWISAGCLETNQRQKGPARQCLLCLFWFQVCLFEDVGEIFHYQFWDELI